MAIDDSDLDICFSTNDFGVEASFASRQDPDYIIHTTGYYTAGSDAITVYDSQIEAIGPTFVCRESAIAGVARNWEVLINGQYFSVVRIERVGNGVATVYLKTI